MGLPDQKQGTQGSNKPPILVPMPPQRNPPLQLARKGSGGAEA